MPGQSILNGAIHLTADALVPKLWHPDQTIELKTPIDGQSGLSEVNVTH